MCVRAHVCMAVSAYIQGILARGCGVFLRIEGLGSEGEHGPL